MGGRAEQGTLVHCWERKLVQPLETVWRSPPKKKLKIELLCHPAIPLPGMYPKEIKRGSQRGMCTRTFTALSTAAKIWKQSECLSSGG